MDMINFLKYHGAKVYNKKIYLNSIPAEDFPILISRGEHSKAYFDIKEGVFYKLSWKYGENLKAKAEEEKELVEEWLRKQEAKQAEALATNEAVQKEESAKQAIKAERLKVLRERAKAKKEKEGARGFHNLFLAIYEKFLDDDREALRKTTEAITHGKREFERINNNITLDLKANDYLQESIISLISKQINKANTFDDLLFYIYTNNFEEMSKDVISFIGKEQAEPMPAPANAEFEEKSITSESEPLATVVGNGEIKLDKPKTRSEAQKKADEKYSKSDKFKAVSKKYRESEKGRLKKKTYRHSGRGRQIISESNKRYAQTDHGKQMKTQAYLKYSQSEKGKQARLKAVRAYRKRQKQKQLISTVVDMYLS